MSRAAPRNMSASVGHRLLLRARESGDDYQYVLMRYGLERLMYRLSRSRHAERFVVKGAMLFLAWTGEQYRPTKDLDLMAAQAQTAAQAEDVFRELCAVEVEDDGLRFAAGSVKAEEIRENDEYGGLRVTLRAGLGKMRIPVQVDIGFGDAVTPPARDERFPALLDLPAPVLAAYPRETVVAEKFETAARLGIANSRMKDYYDLWALSREFPFDGEALRRAIRATFRRRKTALPSGVPLGLSDEFSSDPAKRSQWRAFVGRTRLKAKADDIGPVVEAVRGFVWPPALAAGEGRPFLGTWPKGGPWQEGG